MPIKPANRALYPPAWPAIRRQILARAGHRCERCGLPNHAVGYRLRDGSFVPLCGNGPCDAAGQGQSWPDLQPHSYADALRFIAVYNCCEDADADGNHWMIIVLTVAHLNHDPRDNRPENLQALCQRCHNRHDRAHRAETRKNLPGQELLFATDH
jgi:5-methylcytosine-specific restriction endonuclease McrA